ncbi:MAG: Rieske 2Fe-2S domain-containing protein [Chloroflexi bacterium]|nr:Rieske 2Fe-2S domain-containing protein [Chloroflexota bacterium]
MAFVVVAKKDEIPEGAMIGVEAGGRKLLVANVGGGLHAMDATCSHAGGDLTKGKLEGSVVTCPRHGAQYDVTTGRVAKNVGFALKAFTGGRSAADLNSYEVVVEGDDVKVRI